MANSTEFAISIESSSCHSSRPIFWKYGVTSSSVIVLNSSVCAPPGEIKVVVRACTACRDFLEFIELIYGWLN